MSANPDSEDIAIEQPTIALFAQLGWQTLNCYHETFGPASLLGRGTKADVLLPYRLRPALERLNPGIPPAAIDLAEDELATDRSGLSLAKANQTIYDCLKDGIKVSFKGEDDQDAFETVQVIDWDHPADNDFLLVSQFWISGDYGNKRADLVGFVNGIPLILIELKASHKRLEIAYEKNLSDYRNTIPQLFWYNAAIILSNGSKARIGSMTAGFERFSEWKKVDDEGEPGQISLETMIRGVGDQSKLLDLIENFTVFDTSKGELNKLVGKNHQVLGVNNAITAVRQIRQNHGKLGVFWHTQGSGKSYSMVFFAQKVLRKIPGNWTFVIITDRDDLDGQIYKNFAATGAVVEDENRVRADSGESLKRMLNQEDHRYVFTLIQKFHTERGEKYPVLSTRSDIILMADEAHRSQYDVFARNMRSALPNAAFIGFTGTPLMAGEELTKQEFGDYVSVYNFKESVEDANTVPLYYENRIPELQLTNENLTDDIAEICDRASLDEDQERKLERTLKREYHLITREDRLNRIAEDIVAHFMGRGVLAKAMVICIDKATAVKTFDLVQEHWKVGLEKLQQRVVTADPDERTELQRRLKFFEETDMAVVVSSSQNEIEEFKAKDLDITGHRKRMVKEDLETKFKKDTDPLRIVFVCAMWITGFDVPSCSTIYLDKPMKDHTLMQTIARANRVFRDKQNGLIVDYIGVFRNLQKALAIYGSSKVAGTDPNGNMPVHDKSELAAQLRSAISNTSNFVVEQGVELSDIQEARGFEREKLKDDAVAALVKNDETRRRYLNFSTAVDSLYKSLLPDARADEFSPICNVIKVLAEKIRSELPAIDISAVMNEVEAVLNKSIAADGYVMPPVSNDASRFVDLSQIDFDALRDQFNKGHKTTQAQKLRASITLTLGRMVKLNRTRMNYLEEFQKMIEEYNSGSINVETFFTKLVAFTQKLSQEEKRGIAEQLSEEELVIFDLLTKPDISLTKQEEQEVKKTAKELLAVLKREKLVLDWKKQQSTRAAVRHTIDVVLDSSLPRAYTPELYDQKCDAVYQHVFESYVGQGTSLYS